MKKVKRQHKYFREKRYKEKLEHEVDNHKTYYSNVYFITKEPDPKYIQEQLNKHWPYWWTEEKIWEYLTRPERGRDYYIYYDRPDVPYSIQYYHKRSGRSKHQKDLKKRTNKRLRQRWKQYGEEYQNNEYRKVHEFWWELD
jgi:hypothetical protein